MDIAIKQIGIKLPARLNQQIEALARAENNSVSAVVRRILTAGVERECSTQKERRL